MIKWGPKRECTGDQPYPDWIMAVVYYGYVESGSGQDHKPGSRYKGITHYQLPAEYEALIEAKEPTHEQMRETLAARYKGIPTKLIGLEPAGIAYNKLNLDKDWYDLYLEEQDAFRAIFEAGEKHERTKSD